MRTVVRRLRLDAAPEAVFAACLEMLGTPDPRRGVVARRCDPDPPRVGSVVVSTVREGSGERELRAAVVALDPPRLVATANQGPGAAVRTTLECTAAPGGGSRVTLTIEADSGFPVGGATGRALDLLLLGGPQRRSARATLRRLRELVAGAARDGGGGRQEVR